MSLFDGFRKKKEIASSPEKAEEKAIPSVESEEEVRLYFENPIEFAVYCKLYANGRKIIWVSADDYIKEYQKGYQLFEQGQFIKAIETYKACLKLNPIGLNARFEMCEAYLQLHKLSNAKSTLLEMKDYLIEEKSIARFYRRMGFIEIENNNFKVAASCYQYSLKFENHPSVMQELMYIKSKGGFDATSGDPEKILTKAGIPVLTKTTA